MFFSKFSIFFSYDVFDDIYKQFTHSFQMMAIIRIQSKVNQDLLLNLHTTWVNPLSLEFIYMGVFYVMNNHNFKSILTFVRRELHFFW